MCIVFVEQITQQFQVLVGRLYTPIVLSSAVYTMNVWPLRLTLSTVGRSNMYFVGYILLRPLESARYAVEKIMTDRVATCSVLKAWLWRALELVREWALDSPFKYTRFRVVKVGNDSSKCLSLSCEYSASRFSPIDLMESI